MKIIGIVGGVASGKSFVAKILEAFGAAHLDADAAGHTALREPEVVQAARDRWGDGILDADGEIDRRRLAKIVFAEDAASERKYLESLTHPRIRARLREEISSAEANGKLAAVVDAALLFESAWHELCDVVLFVDAPDALRCERALERGWTEDQWRKREASQLDLAEKRSLADIIVPNDGNSDQLKSDLHTFWDSLLGPDVPN